MCYVCCWSVIELCPTLCNPMDCSMSGPSVLHYLPNLLRFMPFELVMQSNHLILCCPVLLLPSIFPSIRVFSKESNLRIRWYWSFSISSSVNIQGWFPLRLTGLISLLSKGLSRVLSSTIIWKHPFFGAQPSLWCNSHIHMWLLEKPWLWLLETFVGEVMSLLFNTPSGFS